MLPSTIEDLILYIYDPMNGFDRKGLPPRDRSILFSMASQLKKPLSLTERQGTLAVKIISENRHLYESISTLNSLLEFPIYKNTFRVVDISRRIFLFDKETIGIKFPFDAAINKLLDRIPGRKIYDINSRCHKYKLNEVNLIAISNYFQSHNFLIDTKIQEWIDDIKKILKNPEEYVPTIDFINGNLILRNCGRKLEEYYENNKKEDLIANVFLAKTMNLDFTVNISILLANAECNNISKKLLGENKNKFSMSNKRGYTKTDVTNILKDSQLYPILVSIDDNEKLYSDFNEWIKCFNSIGISNKEISVLFRSDKTTEFNNMIKEQELNNLVDINTKVVFIKHKVPKIIYKINFVPKIIISTSTFYVHYTNQKMVDSHPLVLYYTEQDTSDKRIAIL